MTSIADSLRLEEYTGENRCTPCTIVNTAIAAAVSLSVAAAVGLWTALGTTVGIAVGVVVFAACGAAIYLRGYLVPKTPELTKRYFPDRVLAWFDKASEPGGYGAGGAEDATATEGESGTAGEGIADPDEDLDPETALLKAGAVEECADVDDLCLSPDFETAWRNRVREARESDPDAEAIVAALDLPEMDGEVTVEQFGDAVVLERDGREIGKWESTAALVADLAAAGELAERYDRWDELGAFDRSRLLRGLRIFAERCPECDGPISLEQDTVESCCRSFDVVAVTCEECGSRLFEERMQGQAT
jgi:hypothetical protein